MEIQSLNGAWQVSSVQNFAKVDEIPPAPALVPGCVHLDLLRNSLIEDPYYRDNETRLLWIGETDWRYQRVFDVSPELLQHEKVLLRCHGLDTIATIRLNGVEIGHTENMYRTWEFDAKPHLQIGENQIEVYFHAPMPFHRQQEKEKGVLYAWSIGDHRLTSGAWIRKEPCNFGWDWGPMLVTSGIWRDIELVAYNTARLTDLHILQNHDAPNQVVLTVKGTLEKLIESASLTAEIQIRLGQQTVAQKSLEISDGTFETDLAVTDPQLWWPNGMGEQPLYELAVQICGGDTLLDEQTKRLGLRTLQLERHTDGWGESFHFSANGVPFFAKGANWIPASPFAAALTRQDYAQLLQDTVAANMNMLRVWGGGIYEADDFYDLCDELGICVWQDFMFACGTYPAYDAAWMANVEAEARDNIRRIRHHTSIALWCGNNELEQGLVKDEWSATAMSWEDYGKLFDVLLRDVTRELDPQRPYWPGSPHSPKGERADWMNPAWGDTHLWDVWHGRKPFEWYRTRPDRFVSEFGFQSFPEPQTTYGFTKPEDRNITSYIMEHHQRSGIGNQTIIHYLLDWFQMPTSFESTLWLSQILQGMAIKYAVEHWRRNMPVSMGSLYWQLNDCWPAPSWSSIDSTGRWKALHYIARHFYAPLLISGVENSEAATVDVHVTSDLPTAEKATVRSILTDTQGNIIQESQLHVTLPSRHTAKVITLDYAGAGMDGNLRDKLVWLELIIGDQVVADNLVTFVRPKHLPLPQPNISTEIQPSADGGFHVTLTTDQPALWTWLETATPARFSDNFLHLRPGRSITVTVYPSAPLSLAGFQAQLKVHSLVNTYQSQHEFAF